MLRRRTRFLLVGVLVVVGIGATLFTRHVVERDQALSLEAREVSYRLESMRAAVSQIRAAQHAYVAQGQAYQPWADRASALIRQLNDDATAAVQLSRSAGSQAVIRGIVDRTNTLTEVDANARDNLRLGRDLMASDQIFSDGQALIDAMLIELRGLATTEEAAFQGSEAALYRQLWSVLGLAALTWLGGLFMLARTPLDRQEQVPVASASPLATSEQAPEVEPVSSSVDLEEAAAICTAISQLSSAAVLPGLLARAARVLDASGLVVWLATGEELVAVAAHGYDLDSLQSLGPLGEGSNNATFAAWRTGTFQSVQGDPTTNGAIVAPMFHPEGCVGALAAEVPASRVNDPGARAVAMVLSAQLAPACRPRGSTTPQRPPRPSSRRLDPREVGRRFDRPNPLHDRTAPSPPQRARASHAPREIRAELRHVPLAPRESHRRPRQPMCRQLL